MKDIENIGIYTEKLIDFATLYGPKVIGAILVWIIGGWVVSFFNRTVAKSLDNSKLDVSLKPFVKSLIGGLLKIFLVITVLSMLGVEMTSFIALLGAAGLAIGMALSGTLQNFAGGFMILLFKPFKVGDLIETQGHLGHVKEIQMFVTTLITPENKTAIIPNGPISNGDLINYTVEGKIRVDLTFGIAYDADIKLARKALIDVMTAHPKVLQDPAPFVGVSELGDSAVNLAVRPHATPEDYWDVYFDIYEQGKEALDKANIVIPFPQMDVHVAKDL